MHSRRHVTRNSYTPVTRRHARGSRSTFISHMNDASTKFGSLSDARRGDCSWERQPSPRTKVTLRLTCWACWSCTRARHHLLSCIRFMTLRMESSWSREVTANSSSCFHQGLKGWESAERSIISLGGWCYFCSYEAVDCLRTTHRYVQQEQEAIQDRLIWALRWLTNWWRHSEIRSGYNHWCDDDPWGDRLIRTLVNCIQEDWHLLPNLIFLKFSVKNNQVLFI